MKGEEQRRELERGGLWVVVEEHFEIGCGMRKEALLQPGEDAMVRVGEDVNRY
jgi:hypothetical protein